MLLVLILGLVIDVMKPATLGFVLGMSAEYQISKSTVAWFPFTALVGTTIGSFVWGWLADKYGRRVSILLSTILFVSTSICGALSAGLIAWAGRETRGRSLRELESGTTATNPAAFPAAAA